MIKNISIIIVCIIVLLSFVACGENDNFENDIVSNQTETSTINDTLKEDNSTDEIIEDVSSTENNLNIESTTVSDENNSTETNDDTSLIETTSDIESTTVSEIVIKPTKHPNCIYEIEKIIRVTFYGYYGTGEGKNVPNEYMPEIISWLGSFTIGEKANDLPPPGTNTYYVEIEYSDGTIIKNGLDRVSIDGVAYVLERDKQPECFMEIISKKSLE